MILAELLKNMQNWTDNLFSEGELADYLIVRWQRFVTALNAARQDGSENRLNMEDFFLQTPELLPGFEIVEHGFVDQNPLLPAAVILEVPTESGAISLPHPRKFYVLRAPFRGDADLFRYRSPDCALATPKAMVCGQYLHLEFERSGSADKEWKGGFLHDFLAIYDFLDSADVCVKGFNERVRKVVQ